MLSHEQIVLRLVTAAILGAAVGLERERLEWAAGLRTHMLVCLGSTLLMIVSSFGFEDSLGATHVVLDPSRVAAQVVSGIGFLGAGTILFLRQEVIRGLTTAASLWTIAAIGLAVGGGLYLAAVTTTGIVLVILAVVKPVEQRLFRSRRRRRMTMLVDRRAVSLPTIRTTLDDSGVGVLDMTLTRSDDTSIDRLTFTCAQGTEPAAFTRAVALLQAIDGVREVSV